MSMNDPIIYFRSLEEFPNHEEALRLLKKIASHVKPIMNKRNWRVGSLEEFWPTDKRLLGINVNHGAKICIRLRPHYDKGRFYDFDDLIGTMLHELTHIKISPHDATFYKLLDELNDEYDKIIAEGEGFLSNGRRVGEGVSHDLPPALARQKALEAAEKRRKTRGLMPNGGRRLGGGNILDNGRIYELPLRELTAMAAERRRRDNFWCGVEQKNRNNNNNGTNHVIKKPTVGSTTTTKPISAGRIPPNKIPGLSNANGKITSKPSSRMRTKHSWETTVWACLQCTFLNRPLALQCDVCLAERPNANETSSSISQPVMINDDDLYDFSNSLHWSCPKCTFDNASDIIMCLGCDYLKE